jgi:hypothetical protein
MKKLAFVLAASVMATVAFSQVVTIKVTETQLFSKKNKNTFDNVLLSPDSIGIIELIDANYILDLNKQTCTLYINGEHVSILKFKSISKINDNVYITFIDRDKNGSNVRIKTTLYLNIQTNLAIYTYYSKSENLTKSRLINCIISID